MGADLDDLILNFWSAKHNNFIACVHNLYTMSSSSSSSRFSVRSQLMRLIEIPEFAEDLVRGVGRSLVGTDDEEMVRTAAAKKEESFELLDFLEPRVFVNHTRLLQEETMALSQQTAIATASPSPASYKAPLQPSLTNKPLFLSQETACSSTTSENIAISQDLLSPLPAQKQEDSDGDESPFIELPVRTKWEGEVVHSIPKVTTSNQNTLYNKRKLEGVGSKANEEMTRESAKRRQSWNPSYLQQDPSRVVKDVVDLASDDLQDNANTSAATGAAAIDSRYVKSDYEVLHARSDKKPLSVNQPVDSFHVAKTYSDHWFDSSKNKSNKKLKQATLFDLMK